MKLTRIRQIRVNIIAREYSKARVKRRTSHVPNLMLMSKFYCSTSFALDSAHVKFDVWPGPKRVNFDNFNFLER